MAFHRRSSAQSHADGQREMSGNSRTNRLFLENSSKQESSRRRDLIGIIIRYYCENLPITLKHGNLVLARHKRKSLFKLKRQYKIANIGHKRLLGVNGYFKRRIESVSRDDYAHRLR